MESQIDPTLAPATSGENIGKVEISDLRAQLTKARDESTQHGTNIESIQDDIEEINEELAELSQPTSNDSFQELPHLVGIPAANLGSSVALRTVAKAYTFANASIAGGVLTLVAAGTPAAGTTAQLSAGGFPLDTSSNGLGTMIYDTNGLIPHGTFISTFGSGGTKFAPAGNYNLTNFFGTAIPDIAAGATIFAAACYNATTNYLLKNDCNKHQAMFGNFELIQGLSTTGSAKDKPVVNDLRLYAYYEFQANDGVNTRTIVPATFDGKDYLVMPGNVLVKKRNDPVYYPGYADQIVAIHVFVINNDLKGSAFTIPGYNATGSDANTGLREGILYGGANYGKQLTSDVNYWGGAYRQQANQYRPFSFIAQVVKNKALPEVTIAGDSISSHDGSYISALLKEAGIPSYNTAKGGEAQYNWPMNVQGRMAGMAGNIFVICLATNGGAKGAAGAADILALVKQARISGFKRVVAITSSVQTTATVQISSSSITGNILTVAGFTTGTELPVGAVLGGGTIPFGTKVSAKIDPTHYTVVNADGSAYTGGDSTSVTVRPWSAEVTQSSNVTHVAMNNVILSWPKGGDYPDEILDVWAATRSPLDQTKFAPDISIDGVHFGGVDAAGINGNQRVINYGIANSWINKIKGV